MHGGHARRAVLRLQESDLALTDSVLTRARPFHLDGPAHHALVETLRLGQLRRRLGVDDEGGVKVPVPHVSDDAPGDRRVLEIRLGLADAFGEPRDGDAHVGRQTVATGPEGEQGRVCVVASLPEPVPLVLLSRVLELRTPQLPADLLHCRPVVIDVGFGAVELEEDRGGLPIVEPRVGVDGRHGGPVQELGPGQRDPDLDCLGYRGDRAGHGAVRTDRRGRRLGDGVQPQGDLGDDAQGSFRADEEVGEVVPGRRLPGPPSRAHDGAVSQHGRDRDHVLTHRPVAHRRGPRRPGCGHPPQGGVGPRVDREHETGSLQLAGQLKPGDPRLHRRVQVVGADCHDRVHPGQVHRDPASQSLDVPFDGRPCAEGDEGSPVLSAQPHQVRHLPGVQWKDDGVGRDGGVVGVVLAVVGADRFGGGEAVTEAFGEDGLELGREGHRSEAGGGERCEVHGRGPLDDQGRQRLPRAGCQRHPEHLMPRGQVDVDPARDAAEHGEGIRDHGPHPHPLPSALSRFLDVHVPVGHAPNRLDPAAVQVSVHPRQLHGSGDAEAPVEGRETELRFHQVEGLAQLLPRAGNGDGVSLSSRQRKGDPGRGRQGPGLRSGRQDHRIDDDGGPLGDQALDPVSVPFEASDRLVLPQLDSPPPEVLGQARREALGPHVAVRVDQDSSLEAALQHGLPLPDSGLVEDVVAAAGQGGRVPQVELRRFELCRIPEGLEDPRPAVLEIDAFVRHLFVEPGRVPVQCRQSLEAVAVVGLGAVSPEPPQPGLEARERLGLDVEGTSGLHHPQEGLARERRAREGGGDRRADPPGVSCGASSAHRSCVDDDGIRSLAGKVPCRGQADHPAADDPDPLHDTPVRRSRFRSGPAGSSRPECLSHGRRCTPCARGPP